MSKSDVVLPTKVVTKRSNGSLRVQFLNNEPSMTQQCFADASDINKMMKRWLSGGPPPVSDASKAVFKDVSHGMDYREILDTVLEVQESFMDLPAELRAKFSNDPAQLLEFVGNPHNYDQAVELGLIDGVLAATLNSSDSGSEQSSLDVTVRTDTTVV